MKKIKIIIRKFKSFLKFLETKNKNEHQINCVFEKIIKNIIVSTKI